MTTRQKELARAMLATGLLMGLALLVVSAKRLGLVDDPELGIRLFGVLCGFVLAAYANVVPKKLLRLDADPDRAARKQACLRFCGWVFALAGLANAAIWALAPIKQAAFWSMVPLLAAFGLVGWRIASSKLAREKRI